MLNFRIRVVACMLAATAGVGSVPAAVAAPGFLAKSNLTFPQQAGRFSFESDKFDPARPENGVVVLYAWPGKPENAGLLVQVSYVPIEYESKTPAQVARQLEDSMRGHPAYQQLQAGTLQTETVPRPPSFLSKGKTVAEENSIGTRQAFSYRINGTAVLATTMIFRHALHEFRLTLASPADAMTAQAQEKLAVEAANALIPAIDVRNFGRCGFTGLDPESEAETRAEELQEMQRAAERAHDRNCSLSEAEQPVPPPKGGHHYTLSYPPR